MELSCQSTRSTPLSLSNPTRKVGYKKCGQPGRATFSCCPKLCSSSSTGTQMKLCAAFHYIIVLHGVSEKSYPLKIGLSKITNFPRRLSCACVLSLSLSLSLSLWTPVAMSWRSSRPEVRRPASGWGSLWESSSFVPWLIVNTFRDVSGVVPEWPWNSGFMRKSSSLASAPSIWFSVLLNSCDNFLVTLPPISSETWVI